MKEVNVKKALVYKVGGDIYIGSRKDDVCGLYISHGGLTTIREIRFDKNLGVDHFNAYFVVTKEVPGHSYNLKSLIKKQKELKERFGTDRAYPDPDYNDYGGYW